MLTLRSYGRRPLTISPESRTSPDVGRAIPDAEPGEVEELLLALDDNNVEILEAERSPTWAQVKEEEEETEELQREDSIASVLASDLISVDDPVRAVGADPAGAARAGGRDDSGTGLPGQLDGVPADRAARPATAKIVVLNTCAVTASAERRELLAVPGALDDVGRCDGHHRGHGLVGDVGKGRENDGGRPGARRGLLLSFRSRRDVHGAGHDHPEDDGRSDQRREGERSLG